MLTVIILAALMDFVCLALGRLMFELALSLTRCVTSGILINISKAQFFIWKMGTKGLCILSATERLHKCQMRFCRLMCFAAVKCRAHLIILGVRFFVFFFSVKASYLVLCWSELPHLCLCSSKCRELNPIYLCSSSAQQNVLCARSSQIIKVRNQRV